MRNVSAFQPTQYNSLLNGLVSYWKLDETSGNAVDNIGGNTGVNTNVTYAAGKINNGAVFNGTAYLTGSTSSYQVFTYNAWVYNNNHSVEHTIK